MKQYVEITRDSIKKVFDDHYLSKESIINRVKIRNYQLTDITELDLAEDSETEITDQNHVGGSVFVEQLANLTKITQNSRILDSCCGLGGSSRLLAYLYYCKVIGIEINKKRYKDALSLTRLVSLTELVSFYCDDILSINLPNYSFDVIWGQGSWNHIEDKNALIKRFKPLLDKNGCIAFEDVYCNINLSENSIILLKELEQIWQSYIITKSKWTMICESNLFEITYEEDLSDYFVNWLKNLLNNTQISNKINTSEYERNGWKNAVKLVEEKSIGYYRVIAHLRQ